MLGVLKTTFRLDDFLKGLKELTIAVILKAMVYHNKSILVKISNGKKMS